MLKRILIKVMLLLAAAVSANADTIGYWGFEEGEGQFAYGGAVANNTVRLRLGSSTSQWQDPIWSTEGYIGNCLEFVGYEGSGDGDIDILRGESVVDVNDFNTDTFTIEAWIKLNSIPTSDFDFYNPYTIFSFGGKNSEDANKDAYFLRITRTGNDTGMLNGYYYDQNNSGVSISHPTELVTGQWYHVAYSHNGSSATDNVKIWVNGVEASLSSSKHPRTDLTVNGESLCIGAMWQRKRCINGFVDEVRVSDRQLTSAELMYNQSFDRETLAYWRFEEQAGQIAHSEPVTIGLNLRRGTSDSDWQDCDWDGSGISGGAVMCYSDIDTGTIGYLTTDAASESLVEQFLTDSFTVEAWINPEYIPLLNPAGTGPEFGFYDPFSIFDIKEWDENAAVTGDPSMFCLVRFMPNGDGTAGNINIYWYDRNGDGVSLSSNVDIPPQQWTHVAFAFDGTKSVDNAVIYVDGAAETFSMARAPRRDQILPKVTVGGTYTGSYVKRGFWGKIDELRYTNQALQSQQLLLPENKYGLDTVYLNGDLNGDLYVNSDDLLLMVENWLSQ